MPSAPRDELLTVPQVAQVLGLARQSVYTAIYQRRLHLARPGRPYRITRVEVERYRTGPKLDFGPSRLRHTAWQLGKQVSLGLNACRVVEVTCINFRAYDSDKE